MTKLPSAVDHIDDAIDAWWERLRGRPVVDRLLYTASEAADFSVLWHTAGVIQAIIEDDPKVAVGLSAALGIESALVNGPVKSAFKRRRPLQDVPRPHHLRQSRTSSFPSGHASAAMVAAALLSRHAAEPPGTGSPPLSRRAASMCGSTTAPTSSGVRSSGRPSARWPAGYSAS